ncbi:MAG: hypothetical protein QOE63_1203 [Acidimicrobiaceae bacterium]
MNKRLPLLAATTLLLTGCGDPQPAEPLSKTLPVAALIAVGFTGCVLLGWKACAWFARQLPRQPVSDLVPVRWLVGLWFGSTAALPAGALAILLPNVAFGYTHEHVDVFRWTEVVGMATWVAAVGVVVAIVFGRAAVAAVHGRPWARWLLGLEGLGLAAASRADVRWLAVGLGVIAIAALLPSARDCRPTPTSGMLSACR